MRLFVGTPFDRPPTCERCGALEQECQCPSLPRELKPPGQQTARLSVEKRKKGKVVTVIRGLIAADNDLPALVTHLKSHCGAGGNVAGDKIEIQGDHVERIGAELRGLGFKTNPRGAQ